MARPQMVEGGGGDQILSCILHADEIGKLLQRLDCVTWNDDMKTEPLLRLDLRHQAALRRLCTRIAASAAGVMPRMREAAPRVAGRARDNRSTISFERPAIWE